MTLGERIKECRKTVGLSQEKVAELVGISRQAVTKWETNQSAPSTENLFKLAEIFGTTVDMLLEPTKEGKTAESVSDGENAAGQVCNEESQKQAEMSQAEMVYGLYKADQAKNKTARRARYRKNLRTALLIAMGYLAVFVVGRLITAEVNTLTVMGFFGSSGTKHEYYRFGWLLTSRMLVWAMAVSVIPSLFGKYRFSVITLIAFTIAIPIGEVLGPNPEGAFYGNTHYGWAIWGGLYLGAIVLGIAAEILKGKGYLNKFKRQKANETRRTDDTRKSDETLRHN